jgi:hypothetical protein
MTDLLSPDLTARYRRDGVLFPLPAVGGADGRALLEKFEALESREGGQISRRTNHKPHLLLSWLADLVRDARILDRVEGVIGPNIFCWSSDFFVKNPGDRKRVSWHQDSTYWGLSEPDIVTAWVALTPSTVESGCMRSCRQPSEGSQLPHATPLPAEHADAGGRRSGRGGRKPSSRWSDRARCPCPRRLIHGSEPNSAHRRIGFHPLSADLISS